MVKKKYDYTITDRAKSHLERIFDSGGKRLVVDLDAQSVVRLRDLIEKGYGTTQKDVVLKAIAEAHSRSSEGTLPAGGF
jgi:saccharopine dehydrogenase-like NADP-dependent oxidoreductase